MSRPLRVLLVDDEPLALRRLRGMLEKETGVAIAGECEDGAQALAAIEAERPDVVLLDVEMPEVDGLEVLARMERSELPVIIFTTAYDDYAVRAFESNAVDYLLKPIEPARLHEAIERARKLVAAFAPAQSRYRARVAVRRGSRILIVRVRSIDWIDAEGNYARLHVGGEAYALRSTMQALESELDPEQFVRIARSTIVNLDRVTEIAAEAVVLADGTRLEVQRPYLARLRALLSL